MGFTTAAGVNLILLFSLYLGFIPVTLGETKIIDLQFTNDIVAEGTAIQATCIAQDVSPQHKVVWYKQGIDPQNSQLKYYKIAENDIPEYVSLDYSFWINKKGVIFEYMMRVESAQVSMSGNYSCAILASDSTVAYKTAELYVIVEPSELKMYVDGTEIESNSSRLFSFSSVHNLQCVANGSNPSAKIDIWHGNQDLTRLATSVNVSQPIYAQPANTQFPFLATITRSTNVTISNWKVDVTYQSAEVKCLARASTNSLGRSVKFTPLIEDGPPHFICPDKHIIPEDGNEYDGYYFVCRVIAKPALTGASFGCEPSSMCRTYSAFPVQEWQPATDTVYSVILRNTDTRSLSPLEVMQGNMTLRIRLKKEVLKGRSYVFTAENARGQTLHHITLTTAGAESLAASLSLCLASIFFSKLL